MPKTVLITGAGSGFGRGAAVALAGRGHTVIATVETAEQAAELAAAHPELTVVKLDVTDPDDLPVVDRWDLDVYVGNAGLGQTGPLSVIPLERVRRVFEVNVFGALAVAQRIAWATRWATASAPNTLTSNTRRTRSSGMTLSGPVWPSPALPT